jgi:hypothetical protein
MEDLKRKLDDLSAQLVERGVRDVKFAFGDDLSDKRKVFEDVIEVLQAVLDGRHTKIASNHCNDSVRVPNCS